MFWCPGWNNAFWKHEKVSIDIKQKGDKSLDID